MQNVECDGSSKFQSMKWIFFLKKHFIKTEWNIHCIYSFEQQYFDIVSIKWNGARLNKTVLLEFGLTKNV